MKTFLNRWNRIKLSRKFNIAFALLLSLIFLLGLSSYISLSYINSKEKDIHKAMQIERLVMEMDLGRQKARSLIGSFFLHYQHSSLQEAHERYAQPSVREISRVIKLSRQLRDFLFNPGETAPSLFTRTDINLYLASAKRFADTSIEAVELVSKRSAPQNGLQDMLRANALKISSALHSDPDLTHVFNTMVIFYKEYLITRQRPQMQTALNVLSELRTNIFLKKSLSDDEKKFLTLSLDDCEKMAGELLITDLEISRHINDFALQEQITEPVSLKLLQQSRLAVSRAEKQIDITRDLIGAIVAATSLLAIAAVLILAFLLKISVTRKILQLTSTAHEFSTGNLHARAQDNGTDELGQLAMIFNDMAGTLEDQLENLEINVRQRTDALAVSETFYRQIFDHGSSAIIVYQAIGNGDDFIIRKFNRAAETIESLKRDNVIGRRVTEVFPGIEDFGLMDVFRSVWQGGDPISHPPSLYRDCRIEGWRQNRVYKLPTGEIVAMYDDLTSIKKAEEEKKCIKQQLQQAEKMEAIGLLAGGVAHDLNNILSAVVNYPELLLLQLDENSNLRKPLIEIRNAGMRAAAVVADLLTVARGVASTKETVDLNNLVATFFDSAEFRQIRSDYPHIEYTSKPAKDNPPVACSTVHVIKCIMNLVINSSEAISSGGTVALSTWVREIDKQSAEDMGLCPGTHVILTVKDSGHGILPYDLEHIFEPFYTKKAMGMKSGTGLGLSIVWNTMQDHGGGVFVQSSDQGTIFDLYFPAVHGEIKQVELEMSFEELKGNGETVLVVDDDPHQREIAQSILKELGYMVACVDSGENAIEYLKNNCADLLLLDILMEPGINGRQTYEQAIKINPLQKALLVSGFSESNDVTAALVLGAGGFIQKPYTIRKVGMAIKDILNSENDRIASNTL